MPNTTLDFQIVNPRDTFEARIWTARVKNEPLSRVQILAYIWHEVPTNQCSGGPISADSVKDIWFQGTRVICLLSGPWNPGLKQDNPVEVNLSVLHAIWSTPCLVVEGWRGPREHPGNQYWGPCGFLSRLGLPTPTALLALGDPEWDPNGS